MPLFAIEPEGVGEGGRLDVTGVGKMSRNITLLDFAQRAILLEALRWFRWGHGWSPHRKVKDAARYVGVSDQTLRDWIRRYGVTPADTVEPVTRTPSPCDIPGMPRIDQAKRALLAAALAEHGGSVTAACRMIGITKRTGYAWKKRFRL